MIKKISDLELHGKRVLVREDLNVPIKDGRVASTSRIDASVPTLKALLDVGAKVAVMSHLGRPRESYFDPKFSLAPVAQVLSERLNRKIPLIKDWVDGYDHSADLVLLENVRLLAGETEDDEVLAKKMAALCDVFVMDAFGTSHRAHSSTHGVGRFAKEVASGPLMSAELEALEKALANPRHPAVAVVGGSKVSTKLNVLVKLVEKFDQIVVGGGIANTFLAAAGYPVGKSLIEKNLVNVAKSLMDQADIPLPTDVIVAPELSAGISGVVKKICDVGAEEMILDVGPETQASYESLMANAETIIWNGPIGVFELPQFENGTMALSNAIAKSPGFSLAGGGDTLAAIDQFIIADQIDYISTGGGAFLEFIEGKELPGVSMLKSRSNC